MTLATCFVQSCAAPAVNFLVGFAPPLVSDAPLRPWSAANCASIRLAIAMAVPEADPSVARQSSGRDLRDWAASWRTAAASLGEEYSFSSTDSLAMEEESRRLQMERTWTKTGVAGGRRHGGFGFCTRSAAAV